MAGQQEGELAEFERRLAAIQPIESRLNHAELLFRAGQASAMEAARATGRLAWVWPLSTALLGVVAATLSWQLYQQSPRTAARSEMAPAPTRVADASDGEPGAASFEPSSRPPESQSESDASLRHDHYVHQRRLALNVGLDALGDPLSTGSLQRSLPSYRDLKATYWEREKTGT